MPTRTFRTASDASALDMGLAEAQAAARDLALRSVDSESAGTLPYLTALMAGSWLLAPSQRFEGPEAALRALDQFEGWDFTPGAVAFELCVDALACQAAFGDATGVRATTARATLAGRSFTYAAPTTRLFATRP